MIEDLLTSLNVLLLQHPHLLGVMRTLFWVKNWLLLGIFGMFVYLAYREGYQAAGKKPAERRTEDIFIA